MWLNITNISLKQINLKTAFLCGCMCCLFLADVSKAETETKNKSKWQLSSSIVSTYQTTSDARIEDEFQASADMHLSYTVDKGEWLAHIEANSSERNNGVSAVLPESNGDAGSALDKDNDGRIQLSELIYRHDFNERVSLSSGLLDVSGFFDQSRIASDETSHFLGAAFTGNPSIEFPDYTLGLVYEHALERGPLFRAAVTSSNGLADNPQRSYAQLIDSDANQKGVFAIGSVTWEKKTWQLRGGLWTHTADHERLDGESMRDRNYGVYMLADYNNRLHSFNLRLGASNDEVSRVAGFAGLGYQFKKDLWTLGAGAGWMFNSSNDPEPQSDDTTQGELYLRYAVSPELFLTGDVQWLRNSNLDASGLNHDDSIFIYGLRVTWLFE